MSVRMRFPVVTQWLIKARPTHKLARPPIVSVAIPTVKLRQLNYLHSIFTLLFQRRLWPSLRPALL